MAQKFIILAKKTDGSFELLATPAVEFGKQKEVLTKASRDSKLETVQMFMLEPHTRQFHPSATIKAEVEAAAKAKSEAAAKAKAEVEAADESK